MNQKKYLWKLQEVETKIKKKKKEIEYIKRDEDLHKKVDEYKNLKELYEDKKNEKEKIQNILYKEEKKGKEISYEEKEIKEKLYGGSIKNPKQLESLYEEEEKIKETIAKMEQVILEYMEALYKIEEEMKEMSMKGRKLGCEIKERIHKNKVEVEKLKKEIQQEIQERKELIETIDENDLKVYQDVKDKKNHPIALLVHENICTGCHMDVSIMTVQNLKKDKLTLCENCGRILIASNDLQ
ncbi:zinc ribbon domain-containing protein [Inediibacterium massiliense]|uniref:zinc ribbon domain-containing protein n=1 Tax=Inediibacterium massiliense TaxID=1658111 RepID=UPI0006B463A8|nr:C4-type zinc ribbon domain-containing protein [Inediibacterium massiliense]